MQNYETGRLARPLRCATALVIVGMFIALAAGAAAAPLPRSRALKLVPIAASLASPAAIAHAGDGLAYDIPPDNPFVGVARTRGEIWAYGLRNPWRFSFDRASGDMFIGDVGQNSREEVDFQPAAGPGGANYGWRCREGTQPFDMSTPNCANTTFTPPILDYDHNGRCAVTGGYRYRGSAFPQFAGVYLYADYCSGEIWGATPEGTSWSSALLLDTNLFITTFGEDEAGELYLADRSGGQVYQIIGVDSKRFYLPLVGR